jgi:hypothetical protein
VKPQWVILLGLVIGIALGVRGKCGHKDYQRGCEGAQH